MESHNQAITKAKPGFLFYFYFYLFIYFILFLGANFRHLVTKNNPAVWLIQRIFVEKKKCQSHQISKDKHFWNHHI